MAGARCGYGSQVEVFQLEQEAGTLDLMATYGGEQRTAPWAAAWQDRVVVPGRFGVDVYQAQVTP